MRTPAGTIVPDANPGVKTGRWLDCDQVQTETGYERYLREKREAQGRPDPACRFSTFCERERWECYLCSSHSRLIDDRALSAKPEISDGKMVFLASLGIGELRRRVHELLPQLAALRLEINREKENIQSLQEAEDLEKARLMLSDPYSDKAGPGRNEETRKAWLNKQRIDDPDYSSVIGARELAQQELATADAEHEALTRELSVLLAEMRLVSAQLAFLAEG